MNTNNFEETAVEELRRYAREGRHLTIVRKERAIDETKKAKNRSAILAGIFFMGTAASILVGGQDVSQVLQHELNALYSWDGLKQYINDLGPLTTTLTAGVVAFSIKYVNNAKKLEKLKNELSDFIDSKEILNIVTELLNNQTFEGQNNDKSR